MSLGRTDQVNYVQASIPKAYFIRYEVWKCLQCDFKWKLALSPGDDLIAFEGTERAEVRWLPTYEDGGYLDLLTKLVPAYSREKGITHHVSVTFETAFAQIQERPESGGVFRIRVIWGCPRCGSREVMTKGVSIRQNPTLQWIRYDLGRMHGPAPK